MRQIIKLTESDLHNIIKESVKQVLNELDWSTKYRAGRKEQDLFDRFSDAEHSNKSLANSDEFTNREKARLKRRGKELGGLGYSGEWHKTSPFLTTAEQDFNNQFGDEFQDNNGVNYKVKATFDGYGNKVNAYRDAPNEEWFDEFADADSGEIKKEKIVGRYDSGDEAIRKDKSGRLKQSYQRAKKEFDSKH